MDARQEEISGLGGGGNVFSLFPESGEIFAAGSGAVI
jgi:hypothetical protein